MPHDYVDVLQARRAGGGRAPPASTRRTSSASRTDFTACTLLPVLADGTPLCELPEFADRPHAYVKLWKHHAAQPQADRINALAATRGESRGCRATAGSSPASGSSPRACSCSRRTPRSTTRMDHWVEAADWIVWQLTGRYVRNACTAGYKGILPGRRATRAATSWPR